MGEPTNDPTPLWIVAVAVPAATVPVAGFAFTVMVNVWFVPTTLLALCGVIWMNASTQFLAALPQLTVEGLKEKLRNAEVQVLDVRREGEWQAGHIGGAAWWPLDNFKVSPPEIDPGVPLAVHCKSGYRSMIACSLLQRAGFKNVINVTGGFDAWQQAKLPTEVGTPVEV